MNDPVRFDERPAESLQIAIDEPRPDVVLVHLTGDLDLLTAPVFRERLSPLLDGRGQDMLIDLAGLNFLGSAGLAELASAHETATQRGVRLALIAGSRAVLRPLEVTRTIDLFSIHESVESALGAV